MAILAFAGCDELAYLHDPDQALHLLHVDAAALVAAAEATVNFGAEPAEMHEVIEQMEMALGVLPDSGRTNRLRALVARARDDVARIERHHAGVVAAREAGESFVARSEGLSAQWSALARSQFDAGAPAPQVLVLERQVVLLHRMPMHVAGYARGREGASAADALVRDLREYTTATEGLPAGDGAALASIRRANAVHAADADAFLRQREALLETWQAIAHLREVEAAMLEVAPPKAR